MPGVDLIALGWTAERAAALPPDGVPARVTRVDRGRLSVLGVRGEQRVRPAAALHDDAGTGGPAVGDWVAVRGELAVAVLPRSSAFTRTVAGRTSAAQVVAANVGVVLVVDALAGAARLRRVERYIAVAWSSGDAPVVVFAKADLCADVAAAVAQVADDALGVAVVAVSSLTGAGLDRVRSMLGPGRTAAVVGPSGVGMSSLANALAGRPVATPARSGTTAAAGTPPRRAICSCCPTAGCSSTPRGCASWASTTTSTASTAPTPT